MKKLLATALAALLLAALGIGVGSLGWRPGTRVGPPRLGRVAVGHGELLAGASAVPISPPAGVPIGGFARLLWRSDGERDRVHVRALALSQPGASVVLVSAELLLVPAALAREVERRVADLPIDHLLLGATHTHAGPGGYWKDPIAERAALGPYDAGFASTLAGKIAEAIRSAWAARAPATLAVGTTDASRLVRARGGGTVDGRLAAARIARRDGGELVAEVAIFGAHPTLLGQKNEQISGDWPGVLARESRAPLLHFQGALGDQSARAPAARDQVERYARRVRMAIDAVRLSAPDPAPRLGVATATAVLPAPDLGASPPLLKSLTKNVLYGWFPDRATVAAVRLGPLLLLAVPAEPVAAIARRWRDAAGPGAEVLSLASDYVGYVETAERMADREGETVRTYYGPELAGRLGAALELAASELEEAVGNLVPLPAAAAAAVPDQNRTAGATGSVKER